MILIGKTVMVATSANKALVGITGTVVEDTKETLILRTAQGEKTLVKGTVTIRLTDGTELDTSALRGTHAARVKK